MVFGHGANPFFFNNKKNWTSCQLQAEQAGCKDEKKKKKRQELVNIYLLHNTGYDE